MSALHHTGGVDSNAPSESRSDGLRNLSRQFQPLLNAGKVGMVTAAVVAGGISHGVHDVPGIHAMPDTGISQHQTTSTFRDRLHAVENHTGLECQPSPRPVSQGLATQVIQHRQVDDNRFDGVGSMHAYGFGQAMKQADVDHGGANASHWTDAFCYPGS
jgi:hypothetical protein